MEHSAEPPVPHPPEKPSAAMRLCWDAQRLLSCLLMSKLTSAGSALLLLLPWWIGPCGMLAHLLSEMWPPQPPAPCGCLPLPRREHLGPWWVMLLIGLNPRCSSRNALPGRAHQLGDLVSMINLLAFMSLNQTLKHRP